MRGPSPALFALAVLLVLGVAAPSAAQTAATRYRGTIEAVSGDIVMILTKTGEHQPVTLTADTKIGALRQLALADIKAGDFIGTAAMKQPDGHLRALEVTVFPEALRDAGEGQRPWDQGPDSSMTNATVAEVAAAVSGQSLTLKYKGGEAVVDVPPDAPVVTPIPGDRSLLIVGKAITASARQNADGSWTAAYVSVEKDGVKPPG
jgi:hypothetical protein